MSLTRNMEMAKALFSKDYIKVEKYFFDLRTKVIYTPTNSKVIGCSLEYGASNGEKIKELLELPDETILEEASKMKFLESMDNGMYDLSFCYSKDYKFAALQLSKYMAFEYRAVTAVRFIENDVAEALLRVLLK